MTRPTLGEHDKAATEQEVAAMIEWLAKRAVAERRRGVRAGPRARDLLVVELLVSTGLRASELARLRVGDVHLAERESYVRVRGGKWRGARDVDTVPLPWAIVPELERWIDERRATSSDPAVILELHNPLLTAATSSRAIDRREVWRIVKSAVRGAGARDVLNAHSLRHFFGTRIAKLSQSSATVQKLMRFRSPRMADRYTHLTLADSARVVGPLPIPGRRRRSPRASFARARADDGARGTRGT